MTDEELDEIEKELNSILEANRLRREKKHKEQQAAFEKKLGELQKRKRYNLKKKKELKELEEKRKKSK
jgi:hypothetical protein